MTKLDGADKVRLARYYQEALQKYGAHSPQALHWKGLHSQQVRFAALCQIANLSKCSVLDVGCGVGDLYEYLEKHFRNCTYTGVDVVPDMIIEAKGKYPQADFICIDMQEYMKPHDYVLASGALTFNVQEGKQFYFNAIRHMYDLALKGVAFNVLDSDHYKSNEYYLVYSHREIARLCDELGCPYVVSTNYEVGDFTVFLHKEE